MAGNNLNKSTAYKKIKDIFLVVIMSLGVLLMVSHKGWGYDVLFMLGPYSWVSNRDGFLISGNVEDILSIIIRVSCIYGPCLMGLIGLLSDKLAKHILGTFWGLLLALPYVPLAVAFVYLLLGISLQPAWIWVEFGFGYLNGLSHEPGLFFWAIWIIVGTLSAWVCLHTHDLFRGLGSSDIAEGLEDFIRLSAMFLMIVTGCIGLVVLLLYHFGFNIISKFFSHSK